MSLLLWQIPLAIALLGLAWFFVSLAFQLGKTLKSIESVVDGQVVPLLRELNQTTTDLNRDLPQLIGNLNQLMQTLQEVSTSEVQPTLHSVQEMTELMNQNVSKIDLLVNEIGEFSKNTVGRANYYRDQLAIPLTDLLSLWSGIKAGFEHLVKWKNK